MKEPKCIFTYKYQKKIKASNFDLRSIIHYEHEQDCCENVYIDYQHADIQKEEINSLWYVSHFEVMTAPWDWFFVNIYNWEKCDLWIPIRCSVFFACRNEQNWYYNDKLDLIIKIDEEERKRLELQKEWCVLNDIW